MSGNSLRRATILKPSAFSFQLLIFFAKLTSMSDRFWLILATFAYGLTCFISLYRAPSRFFKPTPIIFSCFIIALGFHTVFLVQRGNLIKHCPVSTLFEVLVFVAWSLGLAYLIVGPLYRMTLLGALTSPAIFLILITTQLFVSDKSIASFPKSYVLELHAALNILAYGALGLAGLTGIIFLLQDSWLKQKKVNHWLSPLPSLNHLAHAQRHILAYGFILLTLGLTSGLFLPQVNNWLILSWAIVIWSLYLTLLILSFSQRLSGKKIAIFSLLLYFMLLFTFWNARHIPYS